jgi:hypothetical protein
MDWWQGGESDPATRAQGCSIGLGVLKEYHLDGACIHIRASERDHHGNNHEVENMLG